jgi:hypothetical protein
MRFAVVILSGALTATGTACRGPTVPEYVLALSLQDSVFAKRSTNEVSLAIGVQLTNHDSQIVFYDDCGHALQKREGTQWRAVWSPPCVSSGYSYPLYPGDSHLFTFRRRVLARSTEWPAVNAAGEYRMVLWLTAMPRNSYGFPPKVLGPNSRTSPVFGVREVMVAFQESTAEKENPPRKMG